MSRNSFLDQLIDQYVTRIKFAQEPEKIFSMDFVVLRCSHSFLFLLSVCRSFHLIVVFPAFASRILGRVINRFLSCKHHSVIRDVHWLSVR